VSIPKPLFTVVVPVKGTADGKSRLLPERPAGERMLLAEAFALDAVSALQRARQVGRVVVVTDAASSVAARLRERGVTVLGDPGGGLNAAAGAGLAWAGADADAAVGAAPGPVAVMLGDLPTLGADDLDEALEAARGHPLALVHDAEGSGTTLITATEGALVPHFGGGSAERHRAAGHVDLVLRPESTLRHDVDTEADLQAAVAVGVGGHTAEVLRRLTSR
jgi:2-phospho-L-lactate guanylyltransferase